MDSFAVLQEERRPWLDPDCLKPLFLRLSAEVHPDRFHDASEAVREEANRRYSELNTAYRTLREPRLRLLHLFELETGQRPPEIQRIPPGTMDLFVDVGQTCRDADAFLTGRNSVQSPLLKVRLLQQGMEWTDKLKALQQKVNAKAATQDERLQKMNAAWAGALPVGDPRRPAALPLDQIEQAYRVHSYIARWTEQIQERLVQLMAV